MATALARRFKADVSLDGSTWISLKGITDFSPPISPNNVAADDYDSNGWNSFEKTMQSWALTIKANRKTTSGVFDPGQELVRGQQIGFGDNGRVYVRWYDRNGAPEAFSGRALVGWIPSKTGVADLDEVTITLTGDGILTPITNPGVAATAPIVLSAVSTPAVQVTGGLLQINGSGFTGFTGVKFAAVSATETIFVSDGQIIVKLPSGSAGSAPITVINAVGTSNALPYTRGA